MKVTIDLQPNGNVLVDTDQEDFDVAMIMLALELAKLQLVAILTEAIKSDTIEVEEE